MPQLHAWDCTCGTRNAPSLATCRQCRQPMAAGRPVYVPAPVPPPVITLTAPARTAPSPALFIAAAAIAFVVLFSLLVGYALFHTPPDAGRMTAAPYSQSPAYTPTTAGPYHGPGGGHPYTPADNDQVMVLDPNNNLDSIDGIRAAVHTGMNRQDISHLLGRPDNTSVVNAPGLSEETWVYYRDGHTILITFQFDQVISVQD
jgi:hypothetical protein